MSCSSGLSRLRSDAVLNATRGGETSCERERERDDSTAVVRKKALIG